MRKTVALSVVALVLLLLAAQVRAESTFPQASSAVDALTGSIWQKSSMEEKQAFLYGVDTAINVEVYVQKHMEMRAAKKGKKARQVLSPFEKGWMKAFKDVSRTEIISKVDAWYAQNPQKIEYPVMRVLWFEQIAPKLKQLKEKQVKEGEREK